MQAFFIIQVYYLIMIQRQLAVSKNERDELKPFDGPVSVIVCARNEAKNLAENLPYLFSQKGINFEVVVVNDCSHDNSHDVLRELKKEFPTLKIVEKEEHPRFKTGKKFAVTLGIKAAAHEILVFTDADCRPGSDEWLQAMCQHYTNPKTELVLGYSPYTKYKGLLSLLICYETFQTALNYFSFAMNGMPYMGVGRNMSYKKELFFRNEGFATHMHIPSGDDDLFVNQNATPINTALEFSQQSHVISEPKRTWKEYWNQKLRHLGAGKAYKKKHQQQLTLLNGSAIGFYVFAIVCLILKVEPVYVGILFALRLTVQLITNFKSLQKLSYANLAKWVVILDPLYYLMMLALTVRGLFRKRIRWK